MNSACFVRGQYGPTRDLVAVTIISKGHTKQRKKRVDPRGSFSAVEQSLCTVNMYYSHWLLKADKLVARLEVKVGQSDTEDSGGRKDGVRGDVGQFKKKQNV